MSLFKVVQIMPLGSKLTPPRGHNFTLIYKRKTSNDIFSLTTNGNDPWVVPYQSCSNCSSWLHNFEKSSCLKVICTKALPLIGLLRVTGITKLIINANITNVHFYVIKYILKSVCPILSLITIM